MPIFYNNPWFPTVYKNETGLNKPLNIWVGSLSEYNNLPSKDNTTLYKIYYNSIYPSVEFIGETQIYPIDKLIGDYHTLISFFGTDHSNYDTGFQWLSNNFELEFSLKDSNFTGTQVLISSSTTSPNFNIILNGTNLRLYTTGYNQTIIDTIQANTKYRIVKNGSDVKIYRENTLLENPTITNTGTATLKFFNWNNGYWFIGAVNYISIKEIT